MTSVRKKVSVCTPGDIPTGIRRQMVVLNWVTVPPALRLSARRLVWGLTLHPWSDGVCAAAHRRYQIRLKKQLFPAGNTGEGAGAEVGSQLQNAFSAPSVEKHPTVTVILFPQL